MTTSPDELHRVPPPCKFVMAPAIGSVVDQFLTSHGFEITAAAADPDGTAVFHVRATPDSTIEFVRHDRPGS